MSLKNKAYFMVVLKFAKVQPDILKIRVNLKLKFFGSVTILFLFSLFYFSILSFIHFFLFLFLFSDLVNYLIG